MSVQVKSCQITSGCPVDYAIRIHHWNNKDLVFFQERFDLRLLAYQVVDHSFTYEGTDRLAWMLPGSYQYGLFTFPCFSPYPYCWYDIICKSMSQSFNLDVNLRVGLIFLQWADMIDHSGIGVGLVHSKINLIIIFFKLILEAQVVVSFC